MDASSSSGAPTSRTHVADNAALRFFDPDPAVRPVAASDFGGQPPCGRHCAGPRFAVHTEDAKGTTMGDRQAMMEAFEAAATSGDFGAVTGLVQNYATDDFVE